MKVSLQKERSVRRGPGYIEDAALERLMESRHIGIDEAGRGCLAGPVVAGAVLFVEGHDFSALPGLTDSKKLDETQRDRLAPLIMEQALAYGIGFSWQDEIDQVNILNATLRAMCRAVLALAARLQAREGERCLLPVLLIDGNRLIPEAAWIDCSSPLAVKFTHPGDHLLPEAARVQPKRVPAMPGQTAVIKGDDRVPAISAASILAKTARDELMRRMDAHYPGYGLAAHKGYATKEHLAAIASKGTCVIHRLTFKGVREEAPEMVQGSLLSGLI